MILLSIQIKKIIKVNYGEVNHKKFPPNKL
jgi:hypothetical protein